MKIILIILGILFILGLITLIGFEIHKLILFKKDPHNPGIRTCRKCDAIHHQKTWSMNDIPDESWWEEVSPGKDPNCQCKIHSRNPLPGF